MEKVNKIAGVEEVGVILEACQTRYMARCMGDPSTTSEVWERALQAGQDGKSRHWADHSGPWFQSEVAFGKDGYESIATRLLGRIDSGAERGLDNGESISWGQDTTKVECEEVDLECSKDTPAEDWQNAIDNLGGFPVYTDGSMSDQGIVGGGFWHAQNSLGFKVGSQATVWNGEVAGLERGLVSSGEHPKVILLSDSKAALQAVCKAGRTGKARTRRLGTLMT